MYFVVKAYPLQPVETQQGVMEHGYYHQCTWFLSQAPAGSTFNSGIRIGIEFKQGSRQLIPGMGLGLGSSMA